MRCGYTMDDVGARLPWRALLSLVTHPAPGSSLLAETQPQQAAWLDGRNVAPLLADVYDALQQLTHAYCRCNSRRGSHIPAPKPYPRPWREQAGEEGPWRHYGSGAMEPEALDAWFAARQTRPEEGD